MWRAMVWAMMGLLPQMAAADYYGGLGFGLTEYCDGSGRTFLSDSSACKEHNIVVRGMVGTLVGDYWRFEASFDAHVDLFDMVGIGGGNYRETAAILGGHALLNIPVGYDGMLFFGPSLGGGVFHVGSDAYWAEVEGTRRGRYRGYANSRTDFGWHYGWTLGFEYETAADNRVRVQWQTWNGLNSRAREPASFSSNAVIIFFGRAF